MVIEMKQGKSVRRIFWVVRAAMMLALVVLAQMLTGLIPVMNLGPVTLKQLITGSLVNLVLIVGAGAAGFSATAVAAVLSPVLAFLTGSMPPVPPMIAVVALGNLTIVAVTWIFFRASKGLFKGASVFVEIAGVVIGAAGKCAALWFSTVKIVIPMFVTAPNMAKLLTASFSLPQGVTALTGGILALLVLPAVRAYQKNRG